MTMLRQLADAGRVVIVVTHMLSYLDTCDQLLLVAPGGKTAYCGPPDQIGEVMGTTNWAKIFTKVGADPEEANRRFLAQREAQKRPQKLMPDKARRNSSRRAAGTRRLSRPSTRLRSMAWTAVRIMASPDSSATSRWRWWRGTFSGSAPSSGRRSANGKSAGTTTQTQALPTSWRRSLRSIGGVQMVIREVTGDATPQIGKSDVARPRYGKNRYGFSGGPEKRHDKWNFRHGSFSKRGVFGQALIIERARRLRARYRG